MRSCTSIPWPKQRQNIYHMIIHSGNTMNSRYGKPDHPLPTETRYQDEDFYKKSASDLARLHLNVKHSKNFHCHQICLSVILLVTILNVMSASSKHLFLETATIRSYD